MNTLLKAKTGFTGLMTAAVVAMTSFSALADTSHFSPGWVLNSDVSALRFQSVKNETKVESSTFASYDGMIDETGLATIKVKLDSVDTKVDLRNVRLRFLLFETFQHPEATITMQIDPSVVADLAEVRRKVQMMPYTINLHGLEVTKEAEIAVTLLDDNKVSVTSSTPISLALADFDLLGGMNKLEEAAKVEIIPSATVTFDFTFDRSETPEAFLLATAPEVSEEDKILSAAVEDAGDFSLAACVGRFEIISRTESIYFKSGSASLDPRSTPLLDTMTGIVERCPDLFVRVVGHTDSDGTEQANLRLSQARADSVKGYLIKKGIDAGRLISVGYGEAKPAFPNDTLENKSRNRRIEFDTLGAVVASN